MLSCRLCGFILCLAGRGVSPVLHINVEGDSGLAFLTQPGFGIEIACKVDQTAFLYTGAEKSLGFIPLDPSGVVVGVFLFAVPSLYL